MKLQTDPVRYGADTAQVLRHDGARAAIIEVLARDGRVEEYEALVAEAYTVGLTHGFVQGRQADRT